MKKALAILLSLFVVLGGIPTLSGLLQNAMAADGENLAADYTHAAGNITWDDKAGQWGAAWSDNADNALFGGNSWVFGAGQAGQIGYITIKTDDLKANTEYDFSYVEQALFRLIPVSVKSASGFIVADKKAATTIPLTGGDDARQTTLSFLTREASAYTVTLAISKDWRVGDSGNWWCSLSDLSLLEGKTHENLAKEYTSAAGNINWDQAAGQWGAAWSDNADNALFGGNSWVFGAGRTGQVGYITIKTDDLKANTEYDFSYVEQALFSLLPVSVKSPSGYVVATDKNAVTTNLIGGDLARVTEIPFTTSDPGVYTVTLAISKDWRVGDSGNWSCSLSDLVLLEGEIVGTFEDGSVNLAAEYTNAAGNVSWNTYAGQWGSEWSDNTNYTVLGGNSWLFGCANTGNDDDKVGNIQIKTDLLKANTIYRFSYVYSEQFEIRFSSVLDPVDAVVTISEKQDELLADTNGAHRISFFFTTNAAGVYTITLQARKTWSNADYSGNTWRTVLSDLALYEDPIYLAVKGAKGGDVSASEIGWLRKGHYLVLNAIPYEGNNLVGWYNAAGGVCSTAETYACIATESDTYTAVFDGSQMNINDYMKANGMDGTFETGSMDNWSFSDTWCKAEVSDHMAYTGDRSLQLDVAHNTATATFRDLGENTDCYLSLYVNLPDTVSPRALLSYFRFYGTDTKENLGISGYDWVKAGSGWYHFEFYLNTGANDGLTMDILFINDNFAAGDQNRYLYIDDVSFYTYVAEQELQNGDFAVTDLGFEGEGTVANGVGALAATGDLLRQIVALEEQTSYTLSFRAKGNLRVGAARVYDYSPSYTELLTSKSYLDIDSGAWNEYSLTFYSGVHKAANLFFQSLSGMAMIDDVALTRNASRDGSLVELVDFETDRFSLRDDNQAVYEITDDVAYSGKKSLKFRSKNAARDITYLLDEAYLSFQIQHGQFYDMEQWIDTFGLSYHFQMYYKTAGGADSLVIEPWYRGLSEEFQLIVSDAANGWKKVDFYFNNYLAGQFKPLIQNLSKNAGDFYLDDISLTVVRPMAEHTDIENKYCAEFHNLIENGGFEEKISTDNWGTLPKTATVRSGDSATGEKYLRVKAGTQYILPVKLGMKFRPYYLAATLRGTADTEARISISATPDGQTIFKDLSGKSSAYLEADSTDWSRYATEFLVDDTLDVVFLVISCTKGYLDIDQVSVFQNWEEYARAEDPNSYDQTVFDYDDIDPSLIVENGGFPTEEGEQEESTESNASPETGDDPILPIVLVVAAIFAAGALLLLRPINKQKKGGKSEC